MALNNFAFHVFEKFTEFMENRSELVKISHQDIVQKPPTIESSSYINENIIDDVRATMKVCHEKRSISNNINF